MGVSVGVSVGVFVSDAVVFSVEIAVVIAMDFAVEIAVVIAMDFAVEIAVEITMASALGLHGVQLLAAAFRGSPWNVRGNPWKVRGSPWSVGGCLWNAVDMAVECRGGPRKPPRCSAKRTNNVHPCCGPFAELHRERSAVAEAITCGYGEIPPVCWRCSFTHETQV